MGESIRPDMAQATHRDWQRRAEQCAMPGTTDVKTRYLNTARRAAALVFGAPSSRDFAVRYWDAGWTDPGGDAPVFTLTLTTPGALRTLLLPPSQLRMAHAFCGGVVDVEGDLLAATAMAARMRHRLSRPGVWLSLHPLLRALPHDTAPAKTPESRRRTSTWRRRHSRSRDAAAVRLHYDLSNDFYRLWLDDRMVYSCAYYDQGVPDIHAAQTAKLHYILRKLRLRPGHRLLDVGCGWGGLALLAAGEYGADVVGVTVSPEQAAEARARIAAAGLQDRCRIALQDYRNLARGESYDRIVSVGMCEHVGRGKLAEYFGQIRQLLRPGGLFLNHCLTDGRPSGSWLERHLWRDGKFLDRYIFPDSELPLLETLTERGRDAGFEVRDVEQLREHYVRTVRAWLERLAEHRDAALQLVEPWTYRAWRLYLAGAGAALADGRMGLTQVLFALPAAGGAVHDVPLTRRDLYE